MFFCCSSANSCHVRRPFQKVHRTFLTMIGWTQFHVSPSALLLLLSAKQEIWNTNFKPFVTTQQGNQTPVCRLQEGALTTTPPRLAYLGYKLNFLYPPIAGKPLQFCVEKLCSGAKLLPQRLSTTAAKHGQIRTKLVNHK